MGGSGSITDTRMELAIAPLIIGLLIAFIVGALMRQRQEEPECGHRRAERRERDWYSRDLGNRSQAMRSEPH
jgi:hypothetical protein